MSYVTILRNKLHGPNRKGSGPQGKYMAGDMVDDTMEAQEQLDRWVAAGVAQAAGDVEQEEAKRRGDAHIEAQKIASRKRKAEENMNSFDNLSPEQREAVRAGGDVVTEEIYREEHQIELAEAIEAVVKPRRKRGRPRKHEQ